MDKQQFIEVLKTPPLIDLTETKNLRSIVHKYPFFQVARILYLKGLKNQESFRYNNELKKAAAYTTNRTVLYDFITSKEFNTQKNNHKEVEKPTKTDENLSEKTLKIKKELDIGSPLHFNKSENYSFQQWLQLSTKQPIVRKKEPTKKIIKKSLQESIIDKFIETNPKISRINKAVPIEIKERTSDATPQLMTETLAKVYLEQKKYDKAIKAYEILSLKYPEKSGFFADQIKRIQILQKN